MALQQNTASLSCARCGRAIQTAKGQPVFHCPDCGQGPLCGHCYDLLLGKCQACADADARAQAQNESFFQQALGEWTKRTEKAVRLRRCVICGRSEDAFSGLYHCTTCDALYCQDCLTGANHLAAEVMLDIVDHAHRQAYGAPTGSIQIWFNSPESLSGPAEKQGQCPFPWCRMPVTRG